MAMIHVLERISRVTPGGFVLRDVVTGQTVSDGIVVTYPSGRSDAGPGRARAQTSPSGVFILRGLPGLLASERGGGDADFWQSPPALGTYPVDVADPLGRFLGFTFDATLPEQGLLEPACLMGDPSPLPSPPSQPSGSPPGSSLPVIPFFSAPSRPSPAGMAVLRADLCDWNTHRPAAWALVRVSPHGWPSALGVADEMGRVTVFFPYPEPAGLNGSPPVPALRALSEQSWEHIGIDAFYSAVSPPARDPTTSPAPGPDLCDLLAQGPATLVDSDSPFTALTEITLTYGREVVLRSARHPAASPPTDSAPPGCPPSVLFIVPSGSPLTP